MERRPSAAPGRRIYDDFVPPHEVIRGKDAETFLLQLPGSHSLSTPFYFVVGNEGESLLVLVAAITCSVSVYM